MQPIQFKIQNSLKKIPSYKEFQVLLDVNNKL